MRLRDWIHPQVNIKLTEIPEEYLDWIVVEDNCEPYYRKEILFDKPVDGWCIISDGRKLVAVGMIEGGPNINTWSWCVVDFEPECASPVRFVREPGGGKSKTQCLNKTAVLVSMTDKNRMFSYTQERYIVRTPDTFADIKTDANGRLLTERHQAVEALNNFGVTDPESEHFEYWCKMRLFSRIIKVTEKFEEV